METFYTVVGTDQILIVDVLLSLSVARKNFTKRITSYLSNILKFCRALFET